MGEWGDAGVMGRLGKWNGGNSGMMEQRINGNRAILDKGQRGALESAGALDSSEKYAPVGHYVYR